MGSSKVMIFLFPSFKYVKIVYKVVVFHEPVGQVKMVIQVFLSRFLLRILYVLSVNPMFSKVLILFVGS